MRVTRLLILAVVVSLVLLTIFHLRQSEQSPDLGNIGSAVNPDHDSLVSPAKPMAPLDFANTHVHPIDQLISNAEATWSETLGSQSRSLAAAVTEYKSRYGLPPPPHFDKWYEFAQHRGVQLVDEFDTIHHLLLPFWAVVPSTLRARTREALGYSGNNLMGLLLREGQVVHVEGGPDWLQDAAMGMMSSFIQYLPDMDLAFNIHDEPRVVIPHDALSRLVRTALDERLPVALAYASPKNAFSPRPADVKNNKRIDEVKTTRFNEYPHQSTWEPSKLSCPVDSPARALDEYSAQDNQTAYALSELGFIHNLTAFSDICNSPSLSSTHGFFDRPNAFNLVHELFPIFSQSKMSSFQDILFPSPWYWDGKVSYDESQDMDWASKNSSLWWRGSTTGGFSRNGGWRRQHRQQLVRKLNGLDNAKIYTHLPQNDSLRSESRWEVNDVPRPDFQTIMDVHFSHIGQCDPGDCDAQREFFHAVEPAAQQDAWNYRYLLDMDGNAFSGRFYAFLQSHSLTFKMAVFREWHDEWIKPWVHYVPLSLRGDDGLEAVRYLAQESEGQAHATRMAEASRQWASKSVRREDFEVWFFRLLLEYGRLVDDDREHIGFSG